MTRLVALVALLAPAAPISAAPNLPDKEDAALRTLVEGLFRANFVEGRYVGDPDELASIAVAAGYDPDDARAFLASDDMRDAVAQADARAREMGIGGVPFFIFDGKTAVSGAQEPATIVEAIRRARAAA